MVEIFGLVAVSALFFSYFLSLLLFCFIFLGLYLFFIFVTEKKKKKDIWPDLKNRSSLLLRTFVLNEYEPNGTGGKGTFTYFSWITLGCPNQHGHLHQLAVLIKEHRAWKPVEGCSLVLPGLPRAASSLMVSNNLSFLLCPNNLWQQQKQTSTWKLGIPI